MPNEDNDPYSLSRSSSLLQFETLEKECQETRSNSPSEYSQFSFDSLETNNRKNFSPDSINSLKIDAKVENDFSRTLKKVKRRDDNSYFGVVSYSGYESSESDVIFDELSGFDNHRTWKSLDSLPVQNNNKSIKEKISIENLSEDSGYGDHMSKSNSNNNLKEKGEHNSTMQYDFENKTLGFAAYDGNIFQKVSKLNK